MKNLFFIFAIIVVVIVVAKEAFWKKEENYEPVACTMDAKMCPDGSYVGRVGPKCEFEKCPDIKTNTIASLGQKVVINGVSITPTKLIGDSRCPTDVQCIQAGTVKIEVDLEKEGGTQKAELELSKPITFAGMRVSFINVTPGKNSKIENKQEEYKFEFSVTQ